MALKKSRPVTPSRRFTVTPAFDELTRSGPEKKLTRALRQRAGRNKQGRITVRHRGGGHKRRYRCIDFKRDKLDIPARVTAIEYDPNRSARIALLVYADGEKRYILAPLGVKVGATLLSGPKAEPVPGNCLPLKLIPLGTPLHNIGMRPGRGGQLVRSAGAAATLMSREGGYANLRLPSGEVRRIQVECYATIGQVGYLEHENTMAGKAGRTRWRGRRPTVRGVAMNPVDHPMGGGEGRSSGGGQPVSPWGQLAKGKKTRARRKPSSRFIVKRRK